VKPANVPEIVRESIQLHTSVAHRHGIEFREHFGCATAYVALSADELLRAIGNIFSNAIKYMGTLGPQSEYDATWITVTVSATATAVSVAVQSWGAPFTPDELRSGSIFEWGRRGHFSWQVAGAEGSGIGLHDTKTILNHVGGRITIDSVPVDRLAQFDNKVTTVTLHFPRLDD
jgi:signal transduction histidine kinase